MWRPEMRFSIYVNIKDEKEKEVLSSELEEVVGFLFIYLPFLTHDFRTFQNKCSNFN